MTLVKSTSGVGVIFIDTFDPELHDEASYIETAMRAALVAAREVRS